MFKHLWVERSYVIWPNPIIKKQKLFFIILINNEPMLTGCGHSANVFAEAGDEKRRRLEATSTPHAGNSSVS